MRYGEQTGQGNQTAHQTDTEKHQTGDIINPDAQVFMVRPGVIVLVGISGVQRDNDIIVVVAVKIVFLQQGSDVVRDILHVGIHENRLPGDIQVTAQLF